MTTVKWGILSTANIGLTQLIPAIKGAKNAEVVAIASRGEKAIEVAKSLQIPKAYTSYEELLDDQEIDAVYIPLPNLLHKEWVIKAAQKGKHILCEKPASLTAADTLDMVTVCKQYGVRFMEAFMYQFHPQHTRVKEILKSGEIGEVKLMKSSFSYFMDPVSRESNIRMDANMGGGSIFDVGCYCIHSSRYLLDSEPVSVMVDAIVDDTYKVETTSFVKMKMDNGVDVVFDSSFNMASRQEYEIIGTEGTIKVPAAFRPDVNGNVGKVIIEKGSVKREESYIGEQYVLQVEHFSAAVLDETLELLYPGEKAVLNMKVIEACYQSIKTDSIVQIS
ncbi:Gfo/Idh/MocA family protein [Litchfieldia salsa]|uniref:Predicted dehydrogenase n=1 Tax=Litchfieldia salsa TaxID=930152 RepID=A0A1H0PBI9_9BACI|nr:Gfo/Idh/MocA family oxidoreductase [Litchfieldia salsa]SDP02065.1 Predicted dehydrogenase [Litchfieldia salsa]